MFSDKRVETFVTFNYRHSESRSLNYQNAFERVLAPKSGKHGVKYNHGTMHVSDLWS
jgi:Zn/Cd-binding protein ZinT